MNWHFPPQEVEDFLGGVLPAPAKDMEPARARLQRATRGAVFNGGKRMRSQLVLETAYAMSVHTKRDADLKAILPAACAIELIHAYSLVHDDLPAMDDADTRRGRPSCHKEFGEATAILVGDALLTLAFEIMASAPSLWSTPDRHAPNATSSTLRAMAILARAAGTAGMVGGQMIDIAWSNEIERDHDLHHLNISGEELLSMHALKTGALIRAACEMGAVLGGGDESAIENLSCYGAQLGRAFQLKDDLLDVEGDPQIMGKSASDAANDKITAPAFFGLDETRRLCFAARDAALSALDCFGNEADALRHLAHFVAEREK